MTWKIRGRIAGMVIVLGCFALANAGPSAFSVAAEADKVINYENSHAAMNAAQDEARVHLADFFKHVLNERGIATENSAVKVAIPVADDGTEVIWVTPFARADAGFVGVLANEPVRMPGHHAGDRITFSADQVHDWYFIGDNGRMFGSYTTRVMLPDLEPDQAQRIAALLSDTPIPGTWASK